jgi:hypothetical protein
MEVTLCRNSHFTLCRFFEHQHKKLSELIQMTAEPKLHHFSSCECYGMAYEVIGLKFLPVRGIVVVKNNSSAGLAKLLKFSKNKNLSGTSRERSWRVIRWLI